jgi:hypothetical protein
MFRTIGVLGLVAGLCLGPASVARADRLDARLHEEMPRVVRFIKDNGYKNVGVLRFRAQRGNGKVGFSVGPINANMVERLENLLVIHAGAETGPLFGVTHDAGGAALETKVGSWAHSEAERKKLFEVSYPLAWGDEKVKVDAFLTGKVINTGDLKKTTVTIEAFSKGHPTLVKVAEFTLDTDSSLVRDLGYNFALSRSLRSQAVKARDGEKKQQMVDEAAVHGAKQSDKPQPGATPDNTAGLKLEVRVEGAPVPINQVAQGDVRFEVPCPPRGKSVVMAVKNTSDRTMAFVLKVGGKSTVEQQTDDSLNIRKWVIPAGKTFRLAGYYQGEKLAEVVPFAVLDAESGKKMVAELGERVQFIQLDVFEEGRTNEPKTVSPRGVPAGELKSARRSFRELRSKLVQGSRLVKKRDAVGREFLGPAEEPGKPTDPSEVVEFANPTLVGSLTVRISPNAVPQPKPPQGKEPQRKPNADE